MYIFPLVPKLFFDLIVFVIRVKQLSDFFMLTIEQKLIFTVEKSYKMYQLSSVILLFKFDSVLFNEPFYQPRLFCLRVLFHICAHKF